MGWLCVSKLSQVRLELTSFTTVLIPVHSEDKRVRNNRIFHGLTGDLVLIRFDGTELNGW